MSVFDAGVLRAQPGKFHTRIRGYNPKDVGAYFGRLALVAEVVGDGRSPLPDLPADIVPDAVQSQSFDVVWGGFNRREVDGFLRLLAADYHAQLSGRRPLPMTG